MGNQVRMAAVDIGAESGRVVVGAFDGARLSLTEAHRFANTPLRFPTGLHWNIPSLYAGILEGLRRSVREGDTPPASVGVDTWGVDYALVDRTGNLVGMPFHYRDVRTEGLIRVVEKQVDRRTLFARTGIQFMEINTLYQLLAHAHSNAPALSVTDRLLMVPDLLHYWLSGVQSNERTNATTSQCVSVKSGTWDTELLGQLGVPTHFLAPTCSPGTSLGELTQGVAGETGCRGTRVIVPATHDTASAVAAVPDIGSDVAYISSGTWSLVGVVSQEPVLSDRALEVNITNEGGLDGTYRVLKNVMGLWLVQQIQRTLARDGHEYGYAELVQLAKLERTPPALFDPDDPTFLRPGDMPVRIREVCQKSGQASPDSVGSLIRSTLTSLACKYRWVLERLEALTGRKLSVIYILGGGSKNELLCQLTAEIAARPVWAGLAEATVVGNLLVQLRTLGYLGSAADFPAVVRDSFPPVGYQPSRGEENESIYQRWRSVTGL